ncbi:MAG: class I SAM-dependent methyltransferase [Anaerovoracaceae bacterium]
MLTNRLEAIANEIENGESMADIGTDHGYLPMYLFTNKISPKVIMTDVSKGSLNKARENCKEICPDIKFDLRLGNGLKVIKNNEVDDIVIAGMGGVLISDILGKDLEKSKNFKKIIMQPRTAQGRLRYWLIKKGFAITNEKLVREGRFICEIITASYGEPDEAMKLDAGPDSIMWEMPTWLATSGDPLVREFIDNKIEREKRILTSMKNSKSMKKEDFAAIEANIRYLESL